MCVWGGGGVVCVCVCLCVCLSLGVDTPEPPVRVEVAHTPGESNQLLPVSCSTCIHPRGSHPSHPCVVSS